MIFPRGKVRHQNLMTSYTDVPGLLSALKSEQFSGTIEMEFPENKGILFIESGEIIDAEANVGADSKRMIGPEAIQYLLGLSKQKNGALNVYQLLPEQVAIVVRNIEHEVLFKDLSTDFTRLDKLLLKLREEKHRGFIEVLTKEHRVLGVLFLEEGEPAEMFTISETGPSVFGRRSIPAFVEMAMKEGTILNVYRGLGKVSKKEAVKIPEPVEIPEAAKVPKEEVKKIPTPEKKKIITEETKKIIREEKNIPIEEKKIYFEEKKIPKEEINRVLPKEEVGKVPPKEEVSKISREEPPVIEGKDERKVLILILQEVLSKAEKLVDGVSQKGKFISIFKKSLLEKSSRYPFLDPFSGELDYRDGVLSFKGDVENSELAEGVVDCLRATLFQIEKELPKNKTLPLKLRSEIEAALEPHREIVKRLGVDVALSPFYQ